MASRILVTGGSGLLGWWLVGELAKRGYSVVATYHSRTPTSPAEATWIRLDLREKEAAHEAIVNLRPDIVIHTAAYTSVDGCETDKARAYQVNYLGTLAIARAAARIGARLIYVSTDYVFDGEKGLYSESDPPNPVNYYGLSKLLGETATLGALGGNALIVRVSGLYGYSPTGKRNFGFNALEKLIEGREVIAFYDQYLSPTCVTGLAKRLSDALERGVTGILHLAGPRTSRYEFAIKLAETMGAPKSLIKPISIKEAKLIAKRPRDSSLSTEKARGLKLSLPDIEDCIREFIKTYTTHQHAGDSDAVQRI